MQKTTVNEVIVYTLKQLYNDASIGMYRIMEHIHKRIPQILTQFIPSVSSSTSTGTGTSTSTSVLLDGYIGELGESFHLLGSQTKPDKSDIIDITDNTSNRENSETYGDAWQSMERTCHWLDKCLTAVNNNQK